MKLYIILIILLVIILFIISAFNKIKVAGIKVDEASSGIDVALTKRYDVLTKMIEVVKGYTKHEKEVLFEVVKLRNNMTINEKENANDKMDSNQERINVLVENYPKLKADKNFLYLQKSIVEVEEHLAAARRLYNSNVSHYNQLIEVFPTNIISMFMKKRHVEYFKASSEEKNNAKIDL